MKMKLLKKQIEESREIWIPRNLFLIGVFDRVAPRYFEKVKIISIETDKKFILKNGKTFCPEMFCVLDTGEQIGLEFSDKKPRGSMFKTAYEEVGIESYEIQIEPFEIKYLYAKKERYLVESYWDQRVNDDFLKATSFVQSVYKVIAKWEGYFYSNPLVSRYTFRFTDRVEKEDYIVRCTFNTYLKFVNSYRYVYGIYEYEALRERLENEEYKKKYPEFLKEKQRKYCMKYETRLDRSKGVKI